MTNREKWKRQRYLRGWLVCLICLLVFLVFRAGWIDIDSGKANPQASNICNHPENPCPDSIDCHDLVGVYSKLADIEPNAAKAFMHLNTGLRSKENSKKL